MCASHMYVCVCLPTNRERTHARLHTRTRARARAHTHTHTQFPSRMTIGMLLESMAGKSGAMHGMYQDATPFRWAVCVCLCLCGVWYGTQWTCAYACVMRYTRARSRTRTHAPRYTALMRKSALSIILGSSCAQLATPTTGASRCIGVCECACVFVCVCLLDEGLG